MSKQKPQESPQQLVQALGGEVFLPGAPPTSLKSPDDGTVWTGQLPPATPPRARPQESSEQLVEWQAGGAVKAKPKPPRATARGLCPELQAMARIDRILSELSAPEVARIVSWLVARNLTPKESDIVIDTE